MSETTTLSRRERLRAQTLAELKQHALAQIAEGGPEAVSLSAIARAMGMSGPGLYRYFASRDDLLAALVADGWNDLADGLEAAAEAARRRAPAARFRAVATAFRDWALASPHRYRLISATSYGSGQLAPEQTVPAAHRNMVTLLEAIAAVGLAASADSGAATPLDRQLQRWDSRSGGRELPPSVLQLGILTWTRLHGVISLEIGGVFASMEIDPALLYKAEVEHLIAQRSGG